jgi:hypothetical protein
MMDVHQDKSTENKEDKGIDDEKEDKSGDDKDGSGEDDEEGDKDGLGEDEQMRKNKEDSRLKVVGQSKKAPEKLLPRFGYGYITRRVYPSK